MCAAVASIAAFCRASASMRAVRSASFAAVSSAATVSASTCSPSGAAARSSARRVRTTSPSSPAQRPSSLAAAVVRLSVSARRRASSARAAATSATAAAVQLIVQKLLCSIEIRAQLHRTRAGVDAYAQYAGHLHDHRGRGGLRPALPGGQGAGLAVDGDVEIGRRGELDGCGVGLQLRLDALHRGPVLFDAGQHRAGERDGGELPGQLREFVLHLIDARHPGRQPVGLLAGDTSLRGRACGIEALLGGIERGGGLLGLPSPRPRRACCALGFLLFGLGELGLQPDQGLGAAFVVGHQLPALAVGQRRVGARGGRGRPPPGAPGATARAVR